MHARERNVSIETGTKGPLKRGKEIEARSEREKRAKRKRGRRTQETYVREAKGES